jgi:hypothetical protein
MLIIGDFHSRFQQIAMLDPTTGEIIERRLEHENGDQPEKWRLVPTQGRKPCQVTDGGHAGMVD